MRAFITGGAGFIGHNVVRFLEQQGVECFGVDNRTTYGFVMFTDGMPFGEWGEEEYCETVWIIKGNPGCEPPWGIWAHYEEAAKGR